MQEPTDSVPHKLSNHSIASTFAVGLHRCSYIANPPSGLGRFDPFFKAYPRVIHQCYDFWRYFTNCDRHRSIAYKSFDRRSNVNFDDITFKQYPLTGYAMNNLLVHRRTYTGRETLIALETWLGSLPGYLFIRNLVQV